MTDQYPNRLFGARYDPPPPPSNGQAVPPPFTPLRQPMPLPQRLPPSGMRMPPDSTQSGQAPQPYGTQNHGQEDYGLPTYGQRSRLPAQPMQGHHAQHFPYGPPPQNFARGPTPQHLDHGPPPPNFARGPPVPHFNHGSPPQGFSQGDTQLHFAPPYHAQHPQPGPSRLSHASIQRNQQYERGQRHHISRPLGQYRAEQRFAPDHMPRPSSGQSTYSVMHNPPESVSSFCTQVAPAPTAPRSHLSFHDPLRPARRRRGRHGPRDEDVALDDNNGRRSHTGNVQPDMRLIRTTIPSSEAYSVDTESRAPSPSRVSSASSTETVVSRVPQPHQTPWALAQIIKRGETEDPKDRKEMERKYTHELQLEPPCMASAKFSRVDTSSGPSNAHQTLKPGQTVRTDLGNFDDVPNPLWLSLVQDKICLPTVEEAMDALPITELYRLVGPSTAGVIRISGLPYATTKSEVIAFLGRNVQILRQPESTPYWAVHIVMERESGKSMDCFVEVKSHREAMFIDKSYKKRSADGRRPKMGERNVTVQLSSLDELLVELFPRAKHTSFKAGVPTVDMTIRSYAPGQTAVGFTGFLHPEDLVAINRHAESKERSPFASRCPTRPYETIISIMHKYPWYAPKYVPIHERDRIFDCAFSLMGVLIESLYVPEGEDPPKIQPTSVTHVLLQELTIAILLCPGFTELQKALVIANLEEDRLEGKLTQEMVQNNPGGLRFGGNHRLAKIWPFAALSVIPGASAAIVGYYGYVFNQATSPTSDLPPLPMGNIRIDYWGKIDPSALTLATAARIEYAVIEKLIAKVFGSSQSPTRGDSPYLDSRSATPTAESAHQRRIEAQAFSEREGPYLTSRPATPTAESIQQGYVDEQAFFEPTEYSYADSPAVTQRSRSHTLAGSQSGLAQNHGPPQYGQGSSAAASQYGQSYGPPQYGQGYSVAASQDGQTSRRRSHNVNRSFAGHQSQQALPTTVGEAVAASPHRPSHNVPMAFQADPTTIPEAVAVSGRRTTYLSAQTHANPRNSYGHRMERFHEIVHPDDPVRKRPSAHSIDNPTAGLSEDQRRTRHMAHAMAQRRMDVPAADDGDNDSPTPIRSNFSW